MSLKLPFRKGADVNLADRHGRTPLSYAVWSQNVAVVELLIKAGARVIGRSEVGSTGNIAD
jgi:ankyrin repeat protein